MKAVALLFCAGFLFFGLTAKVEAATYNIGPGQTYTTFAALVAAHTLQPDDIVDGGGNTFTTAWTVNGSGTDGHPITIRNATINGNGSVQTCVNTNSKSYLTFSTLTITNCVYFNISIGGSSYINIDHLTISGTGTLRASSSDHINISNVIATNNTSAYNHTLEFLAPGTDLNISSATISGSNGSAVYSTFTSNITLNDVEATLGGNTSYGIDIRNMTSGTLSLTNVYSGVTRQGVAAGNGSSGSNAIGIFISSVNGVLLNADGIYSSNNRAAGINISNSSLSAGSVLKNFVIDYNHGDGISLTNVPNLTIQHGDTSHNGNNGITAYGAGTSNLITEYVTANYNVDDGINGAIPAADANDCPKGWIVRYTEASYNGTYGLDASGDGFSIHSTCTASYYYIKSIGNANTGMAHTGSSSGSIYNSIILNNGTPTDPGKQNRAGLYLTTNANPGFMVKNNIISGNYPAEIEETAGQNHNTFNYNLYYPNPAYNDHFYTSNNGSSYISWTTYHATNGLEVNSINADPKFVNVSTSDFSLQSTSPAIDAGTNVGLTSDYVLTPVPLGLAQDVGAYEYTLPRTPTIGTPQAESASSIRWNFTDNASDETGFKIYDNTDTLVSSLATPNLTYLDETSLSANTQYTGRYAVAYNSYGNSASSSVDSSIYTLANAPLTLAIIAPSSSSLNTVININNNPADTNFAIYNSTSGKYLQADGTLGNSAVWQTYSLWGSASGTTTTGLSENTQYIYQTKAKNGDNIETASSTDVSKYTLADAPTNLSASSGSNSVTLSVDSLPNATSGSSGYYFSRSGANSGWIQINSWTDTGLSCGHSYDYSVIYRNGDGTETSSISTTKSTNGCGGGGMPAGWNNPPKAPVGGFGVSINNGIESTLIPTVILDLKGGPDTANMAISNFSDFIDAGQEKYTQSKVWNLCWKNSILQTPPTCPAGTYTVYVKYYAPWGINSGVVSDTIIYKTSNLGTGNVSNSTPAPIVSNSYKFYKNLSYRMTNSDVKELQKYLNTHGVTVAPSGAGSLGKETNYFGLLTYRAVVKFQEAHASDILTPNGLKKGTGYFGPSTRAFVNK